MQEEVDVRVNQSGQQRTIAQVYDLSASRMFHCRADFDDPVALDQDFTCLQDTPIFDVEQTRRMQHECVFGSRGLCLNWAVQHNRDNQNENSAKTIALHGSR